MLKGYLKILVLRELCQQPHTGYELMAKLKALTGRKPSAGSIYPLLSELHTSGLVAVASAGRRKIYSLTPKGRRSMCALLREKEEMTAKHLSIVRLIEQLTGEKGMPGPFRLIHGRIQEREFILTNIPVWMRLRKTIFTLISQSDFARKEQEAREILTDADRKLRRLTAHKVR